jgi:hypothetical protein
MLIFVFLWNETCKHQTISIRVIIFNILESRYSEKKKAAEMKITWQAYEVLGSVRERNFYPVSG